MIARLGILKHRNLKVQIEECEMKGNRHKSEWTNLTFAILILHLRERSEGYLDDGLKRTYVW